MRRNLKQPLVNTGIHIFLVINGFIDQHFLKRTVTTLSYDKLFTDNFILILK